jgi:hypothetical protein
LFKAGNFRFQASSLRFRFLCRSHRLLSLLLLRALLSIGYSLLCNQLVLGAGFGPAIAYKQPFLPKIQESAKQELSSPRHRQPNFKSMLGAKGDRNSGKPPTNSFVLNRKLNHTVCSRRMRTRVAMRGG